MDNHKINDQDEDEDEDENEDEDEDADEDEDEDEDADKGRSGLCTISSVTYICAVPGVDTRSSR